MTIKLLLTLTLLASAKCSFSQDTTGGTRPTFTIPLHKAKPKDVNTDKNGGSTVATLPEKINAPKLKKNRKHSSAQLATGNRQ